MTSKPTISTLGELKKSGWTDRSVKEELRQNLIQKLRNKEAIFEGVYGYEKTVIPQIVNSILAHHDILLLGLRGQAKTRILRSLSTLLDEWMPIVKGSILNESPEHPLLQQTKELLEEKGDQTPIDWIPRSARYAEKLATPDTTVADLIGDVDPIKAATKKLELSDVEVINFGLIPRSNRGLFVINELPDLQPRIQVALLNIMQERDISIRGFNVRFPLDVAIYFSANPEDYTNRGNIITPLKDRIDAQILTHYPKTLDVGIEITRQEAWVERSSAKVEIPHFIHELIETIAIEARASEFIDQKSGVSARLTITAMEQAVSAAEKRALINGESDTIMRISDVYHSIPALTGKLELVYEGEQEGAASVAQHIIGKAVNQIFKKYFPPLRTGKRKSDEDNPYQSITDWFNKGNSVSLPDILSAKEYNKRLFSVPGLDTLAKAISKIQDDNQLAPLMDLALDGLHQNSMLSKDDLDDERNYADMVGSVLGSLRFDEN